MFLPHLGKTKHKKIQQNIFTVWSHFLKENRLYLYLTLSKSISRSIASSLMGRAYTKNVNDAFDYKVRLWVVFILHAYVFSKCFIINITNLIYKNNKYYKNRKKVFYSI